MKKPIKFLWEDLYNKRSIMIVNIYNIISTACIVYLIKHASINSYDTEIAFALLLLKTFLFNFFVYVICHIIFIIETKKNKVMKDNPIIKSGLYKVISIFSIIIACIHYIMFVVLFIFFLSFQCTMVFFR